MDIDEVRECTRHRFALPRRARAKEVSSGLDDTIFGISLRVIAFVRLGGGVDGVVSGGSLCRGADSMSYDITNQRCAACHWAACSGPVPPGGAVVGAP